MRQTFWLARLITFVFPLALAQKAEAPSLEASLWYMKNTLAAFPHVYERGREQSLSWETNEPCRISVEDSLIDSFNYPKPGKAVNVTYQIHLGNMDPASVKATVQQYGAEVRVEATNNEKMVWMFKEDDKEHIFSFTDFQFGFNRLDKAKKFADALRRAVTLCGGKRSDF